MTTNKVKFGYSVRLGPNDYIILWDHIIFKYADPGRYKGVPTNSLSDYKIVIRRLFTLPWHRL